MSGEVANRSYPVAILDDMLIRDNARGLKLAAQIAALIQGISFARWRHLVGPLLTVRTAQPAGPRVCMDGNAIVLRVG